MLVRDAPQLVRRQTQLTDGHGNAFVVVDSVTRSGTRFFRLRNIALPDIETTPREDGARRRVWFTLNEMADLAFVRGERRAERETGW